MRLENPYHEGELAVQQRLGEVEEGRRNGRAVSDSILKGALKYIEQQPLAVFGSVDDEENIWASVLVGNPGFMRAPEYRVGDGAAIASAFLDFAEALLHGQFAFVVGILESHGSIPPSVSPSRLDHCVSVESERHDRVALGDQLLQARKPRGAAPPHEIRALCSKSKNGVTLVCQRAQACKPRRTGNRIILNQFESRLLNIVRCSKHVSSATRCTCNCILDLFKQFVCGVVGFNDFTEPPCARALKSNRDVITL